MAKDETECPICFKNHPFAKCGYALCVGFITEHGPDKAKALLDDFNLPAKQTGRTAQ